MNNKDLYVIYGSQPLKMIKELLNSIQLASQLDSGMKIALKPNLVLARPSHEGATTSPLIVEGIIQYLKEHNLNNISIIEGSWVGDQTSRAFKVCGYERISLKYNVPLIDLQIDSFQDVSVGDLNLKVCKQALETDYLINIPVLKAHCQTLFTCALKNLKGCIPNSEKRRYHSLGLHKPIAYLSKALKVDLNIVDALNGDLTFEEGGNPVQMDRIIIGQDPVLVDSYCSSLIGYTKEDIPYLKLAEQLGVGEADFSKAHIYEYDTEEKNCSTFTPSKQVARLTRNVDASNACSACYGSLVHALKRLDENGLLNKINKKILIGQGYKGQNLEGIGIGNCTSKCDNNIKGCPPSAIQIIKFLEENN